MNLMILPKQLDPIVGEIVKITYREAGESVKFQRDTDYITLSDSRTGANVSYPIGELMSEAFGFAPHFFVGNIVKLSLEERRFGETQYITADGEILTHGELALIPKPKGTIQVVVNDGSSASSDDILDAYLTRFAGKLSEAGIIALVTAKNLNLADMRERESKRLAEQVVAETTHHFGSMSVDQAITNYTKQLAGASAGNKAMLEQRIAKLKAGNGNGQLEPAGASTGAVNNTGATPRKTGGRTRR